MPDGSDNQNAGGTATAEAPSSAPAASETVSWSPSANGGGSDPSAGSETQDSGGSVQDDAAGDASDPYALADLVSGAMSGTAQPADASPNAAAPAANANANANAPSPGDPNAAKAPALSGELAASLTAEFGETGTKLVGEMNKIIADLHGKVASVEPVSKRVESVANRQQREDQQRYEASVNATFDELHDAGLTGVGKGESANQDFRIAVHQKADQIAGELLASPAQLQALKAKLGVTRNDDPKLKKAIFANAYSRLLPKQTKAEEISGVRKDVVSRSGQRTVQPGGRSAASKPSDDTSYAGLTAIWSKK